MELFIFISLFSYFDFVFIILVTLYSNEKKKVVCSWPIPSFEASLWPGSPIWDTIPAIPCQLNANMCINVVSHF